MPGFIFKDVALKSLYKYGVIDLENELKMKGHLFD